MPAPMGGETKDILISCEGVDRTGALRRFTLADMGFTYRHSAVSDVIFTKADFVGKPGDQEKIRAEMDEIAQARRPRSRSIQAPAARPSAIRPGRRRGS